MNPATERPRPGDEIQPWWQVKFDDEWVTVVQTVESEMPGGGRRFKLYFTDRPMMVLDGTQQVMSRPPDVASTDAGCSGLD